MCAALSQDEYGAGERRQVRPRIAVNDENVCIESLGQSPGDMAYSGCRSCLYGRGGDYLLGPEPEVEVSPQGHREIVERA